MIRPVIGAVLLGVQANPATDVTLDFLRATMGAGASNVDIQILDPLQPLPGEPTGNQRFFRLPPLAPKQFVFRNWASAQGYVVVEQGATTFHTPILGTYDGSDSRDPRFEVWKLRDGLKFIFVLWRGRTAAVVFHGGRP